MKKLLFVCFSASITMNLTSQNTFPSNGNVGIGTLSPTEKLTVVTSTGVSGITHSDGTIKVGTYVGGGAGYYGTISNHPLYFRTNNGAAQVALLQNGRFGIGTLTPVGRLDVTGGDAFIQGLRIGLGAGNIVTNTCLGRGAVNANTTGANNTGVGYFTLTTNTTGSFNTVTGVNAMRYNTVGNQNTADGYLALNKNITGSYNTSTGANSLKNNTGGYSNVAVGVAALSSNTVHSNLVAIGDSALYNNGVNGITFGHDADYNTAIGSKALYANTRGRANTAVGYNSLFSNTEGVVNTAVGYRSLYSNSTGVFNVAVGDEALSLNKTSNGNTAVGSGALKITTGYQNTGLGAFAMQSNTGGGDNTAVGVGVLGSNTTGSDNTALGSSALSSNQDGNNNTAVGYAANVGYSGIGGQFSYNNSMALGAHSFCTADNIVRVGDGNITSIGGWVNFTNISDGRVKKNIRQNVPGLAFINKLSPVTYNLDLDVADKITQVPAASSADTRRKKSRALKEGVVYSGFVAQDVEKAAKELGYDFSGVDAARNEHDLYGLRYSEFVVPLVQSVQELSKKNEDLQNQVNELKTIIADINKKINGKEGTLTQDVNISSALIQQNLPNPFKNSTTISYVLPLNKVYAQIVITDKTGKRIREIDVSGSGKGAVRINSSSLSAGTYQYSLYINDNLVDTKQMILSW